MRAVVWVNVNQAVGIQNHCLKVCIDSYESQDRIRPTECGRSICLEGWKTVFPKEVMQLKNVLVAVEKN